jgi:hypothetical protein
MASESYDVGDRVKVVTTFRNDLGVPTSPSAFSAEYRKPGAAAATSIVPVDGGSGVFTITLPTFDVPGLWSWYIVGTAGVIAADDGVIAVDPKVTA